MWIRVILAALHLLALGIGVPAVWARATGLRGDLDAKTLRRVLAAILLLEIWPMATLVRWRVRLAGGKEVDTAPARAIAGISMLQLLLVVAMVFAAVAMARGIG